VNTIQQQYIYDRRIYLNRLVEKRRVDNIERIKDQTEKMAQERIRDKQKIENGKGRYVDVYA
jgi:hypothetical protein